MEAIYHRMGRERRPALHRVSLARSAAAVAGGVLPIKEIAWSLTPRPAVFRWRFHGSTRHLRTGRCTTHLNKMYPDAAV